MPTYAPLNDEEAPAIPSLDQLRTGGTTSVEMKQASYEPCEKSSTPVLVESYVVSAAAPATSAPSRPQNKWIVSNCCCGCSLSTGVYLIALIETISYFFALVAAGIAIYLKTQEKKIDNQIYKHDEGEEGEDGTQSTDSEPSSEDEMTTDEKVDNVNHMIDMAAYNSPILIILSLVGLFFCYKGFQASKGNVQACALYYKWKKFAIVWAFIQMIFGGGFGGFIGLILAVYYCIVVRSHWLALSATEAEPAPAEPVVIITTSEV